MSLEHEPSSEPLHISAKQLFLNRELSCCCRRSVLLFNTWGEPPMDVPKEDLYREVRDICCCSSSSVSLSSLELSDAKVYEPCIRALFNTWHDSPMDVAPENLYTEVLILS